MTFRTPPWSNLIVRPRSPMNRNMRTLISMVKRDTRRTAPLDPFRLLGSFGIADPAR